MIKGSKTDGVKTVDQPPPLLVQRFRVYNSHPNAATHPRVKLSTGEITTIHIQPRSSVRLAEGCVLLDNPAELQVSQLVA